MDSTTVTMTAIIAVGALGVVALVLGYDGAILGGTMAIIGGLGGYSVREAVLQYRAVRGGQKLP
jgi:hypothetical protein